jgi:pimeloyl-ACP methyl ester carboxylesterase
MPSLELQGVDLHYDVFGTGPPLLFITGAGGNGSAWHAAAQFLSKHYTTICYDRRNYSSSTITGPQDYPNRLITDASDAAALIAHISPSNKALVLGNSSGAIVALHLLLNHPETVEMLIAHEPPAFGALPPDFRTQGESVINHIYSQYRTLGPIAAMEEFTSGLDTGDEGELMRQVMHPSHSHESRANALFWFEFELRQYPCADLNMDGLVKLKEKLIPAAGVDSGMGVGVAPIAAIAGAVGKEILRLPGGHIGYVTQPEAWSQALVEGLKVVSKELI